MSRPPQLAHVVVALVVAFGCALMARTGPVFAYSASGGYTASDYVSGIPYCCDPVGGRGPMGLAFDSSGNLYVADFQDPSGSLSVLYKFAPGGGTASDTNRIGILPPDTISLAFGSDGKLYGGGLFSGDIDEIDTSTGTGIRTVASLGCGMRGLAMDPMTGDLLAASSCGIKRISNYSTGPGTVSTFNADITSADGINFGPDGTVYVADGGSGSPLALAGTNTSTPGTVLEVFPRVPSLDGIGVGIPSPSSQTGFLLVNRNDGVITKVDATTNPATLTDIFNGGSRGDFVTTGADGCLYATQTDRIVRVTNADGTCSLYPPTAPLLRLAPTKIPPTAVGTQVSFTATLDNAPVGTPITFTVTGANPRTVTIPDDQLGKAILTYTGANSGTDTVVATATVNATPLTSNTGTVLWYAWPGPGGFVVGDTSAMNAYSGYSSPTLDFWGAQWSKVNLISTGQAPAAFKGYASSTFTSPPQCGGSWSWTSTPGASSNPPSSVPTYIAAIVTGNVTKSGATISGNIRNIVILQTGSGYAQGAGHAGSGVIVAVLCGPSLLRTGSFTRTGGMQVPRAAHTASLLPNGQVLVAGGYTGTAETATSELYNPSTGTWTGTGSMQTPRDFHTATVLPNGTVLIAGGYYFDPNTLQARVLNSAELYDPSTGTWSSTGSMNTARFEATATLLPNGKVLVVGGRDAQFNASSSAELYDPSTGTWSSTGSLQLGRDLQALTTLQNGQVLIAGGEDSNFYPSATTELYTPSTGTWAAGPSMSAARVEFTVTGLTNGQVLAAGGVDSNFNLAASAEILNPATGKWTGTGNLQMGRDQQTATLMPNGLVLVTGGYSQNSLPTASAEVYSPIQGTWHSATSMQTSRAYHTATLLPGGKVLIAGGLDASFNFLSSADVYTP